MSDLHSSGRPVTTMPGSSHSFPDGAVCDSHQTRPAVARIQGETDSFGCEYTLMCGQCRDAFRKWQETERLMPKFCDWCHQMKTNVVPHRDMDEGMAGPLYNVCIECRVKESEAAYEELQAMGVYDDDPFFDEDDF